MMKKVYVRGSAVRLNPRRSLGKGGEADVFKCGKDRALKVFKPPDHPDYALFPDQAKGAELRLQEHQTKLPSFPAGLNGRVVRPEDMAFESAKKGARLVGYTMRRIDRAVPLLRLAERDFRLATGGAAVVRVFRDLHRTVEDIHAQGVVIGDFNDLNVLVRVSPASPEAWVIDADSFQYGGFACRVFTERFVDPMLCEPNVPALVLRDAHYTGSDWYAFTVMLVRSLLLTDPYGGIHKPASGSPRVPGPQRPLQRITVFHPEVRYPKPALPPEVLPDDWLEHFERVFQRDERQPFDPRLFDALDWSTCVDCGLEHSRRACPRCKVQLAMLPPSRAVRGNVERTVILRVEGSVPPGGFKGGKGSVVHVSLDGTAWLVHDGGVSGEYRREDGTEVFAGARDPWLVAETSGAATAVARGNQLHVLAGGDVRSYGIDMVDGRPALKGNGRDLFWIDEDGRLLRDEPLGRVLVGEVLPGQTHFWVGDRFGFGYYRAGNLAVGFVFDCASAGLNDGVRLPRPPGTWTKTSATFSGERCFFLATARDGGRTCHHVVVVGRDGRLEAAAAFGGDEAWGVGLHGACAVGSTLLVPTDDGVVRLGIAGPDVVETGSFPDTEPFVDSACRLLATADGLLVISDRTVDLLVVRQAS